MSGSEASAFLASPRLFCSLRCLTLGLDGTSLVVQVEGELMVLHLLHEALEAALCLVLHGAAPKAVQLQGEPLPLCPPQQLGHVHEHRLL